MTHRYIKMGATGTVLTLAFVGLLWSTLRDGTEYFKYVDEVLPQRQVWEGKPLQLKGYGYRWIRLRRGWVANQT